MRLRHVQVVEATWEGNLASQQCGSAILKSSNIEQETVKCRHRGSMDGNKESECDTLTPH
jgi:hypothetical protein